VKTDGGGARCSAARGGKIGSKIHRIWRCLESLASSREDVRDERGGGGGPIEKNARDINLRDIQQRHESDRKTRLVDIFPKIIPE